MINEGYLRSIPDLTTFLRLACLNTPRLSSPCLAPALHKGLNDPMMGPFKSAWACSPKAAV